MEDFKAQLSNWAHRPNGRGSWWLTFIILAVINVVIYKVFGSAVGFGHTLFLALGLVTTVVGVFNNISRLNDSGHSPWLAIVFYIPLVAIWPFVICGFFHTADEAE